MSSFQIISNVTRSYHMKFYRKDEELIMIGFVLCKQILCSAETSLSLRIYWILSVFMLIGTTWLFSDGCIP